MNKIYITKSTYMAKNFFFDDGNKVLCEYLPENAPEKRNFDPKYTFVHLKDLLNLSMPSPMTRPSRYKPPPCFYGCKSDYQPALEGLPPDFVLIAAFVIYQNEQLVNLQLLENHTPSKPLWAQH